MKQIIRAELASELGIPNPNRWNFILIEEGSVMAWWDNNNETVKRLDNGGEYVGNDRSKLVGLEEAQVPWTMEDVPPVCWIQRRGANTVRLIGLIDTRSVASLSLRVTYDYLAKHYKWSADLKTWKSCTKEQ